ncbi:MAG TPA: hypothetical protein DIV80_04035 [Synergistaceae bacterium]|nr:hypothetical protein [Synergistaceae bacterium]
MGIKIKVMLCFFMILSVLLFLIFTPVWVLTVSDGGRKILSRPSLLGYPFITRYIHSVEKTPVEDEYRVVGGRIWGWEERVVSQNAGLPIVVPRNGRLIVDGEWFRFRGGRSSWDRFYYRVGDERLGRNTLILPLEIPAILELFRLFPSRRLEISVRAEPLGWVHSQGWEL